MTLPSGNGQTDKAHSVSVVLASDSDSGAAWSKNFSLALSSKLIVKASSGSFRSAAGRLDATAPTGTYYVRVWDSADVPADLTAATLVNALTGAMKIQHSINSDDYWEIDIPDAVPAANGITIGLSTTEFTQTAAGNYLSVSGAAYR
jgi:hypothetical protein